MNPSDLLYMEEALRLAGKAAKQGEVPVGAVLVSNGKIVGKGYNRREQKKNALYHAEILAIQKACKKVGGWRIPKSTLYITLEPCPMCCGAIINARIDRVVFGAYDPKFGAAGSVTNLFELPFNHKPVLESGLLEERCATILKNFFAGLRKTKNK